MVKGLELFRAHFAAHADQFILIGGTAATITMEQAGLEFRATKDLDIVLHVEILSQGFADSFWEFVKNGGYQIRQHSATGRPNFYRFQKPTDERFPAMLELFCRVPNGVTLAKGSHLTPIPIDEAVVSLSAILLDDTYYRFIFDGRREFDGLPWIAEDRLIPLKASAWLNMNERQAKGEQIDSRNVRKHAMDILRLSQLLSPETRIVVPPRIYEDINRFLDGIAGDRSIDPSSIQIRAGLPEILERIRIVYQTVR